MPATTDIVTRLRAAGCVFAEDEARLILSTAATPAELATMIDRRIAGHPLEHVLGWAEFCGLRIVVEQEVFVPRRRTEFLARQAIELARAAARRPPVVVDMCCGSGALGAALAAALDEIDLHATDIHPASVRCARRNVAPHPVYEGDLFESLPRTLHGRVDVLVANVPYVPTEEIELLPAEARDHEPRTALDGGADGLDVLRRVAAVARDWLAPGGRLLVEASERQARRAADIMATAGLAPRAVHSEDHDSTIVIGAAP